MNCMKITLGSLVLVATLFHGQDAKAEYRKIIKVQGNSSAKYGENISAVLQLQDWLIGPVVWDTQRTLPPGFTMHPIGDDKVEISGKVQFYGTWCVGIAATNQEQEPGAGSFCMTGLDNPQLKYPRLINPNEILLTFYIHTFSHEMFEFDPQSITNQHGEKVLDYEILDGRLPAGINTHLQLDHDRILFEGTIHSYFASDSVTFKLTGEDKSNPLYVRRSIYVTQNTKCPTGQTYDYLLGLCTDSIPEDVCPTGYYLDSITKKCELLAGPCPPKFYFDTESRTCKRLPFGR
jgi:hypothetical protein